MDLPSMAKENPVELRKISDGAAKHLHTLQALKRPTKRWDDLLVLILTSKLDSITLREWEISLTENELPSLKQLLEFIAHRCQVLEATASAAVTKKNETKSQSNIKRQSSCAATVKSKCHFCQGDHAIYYCKNFVAFPVPQRAAEIRSRKLCTNCLRSSSHTSDKCTSGQCKVCQARHNTLLHMPSTTEASTNNSNKEVAPKAPSVLATHASGSFGGQQVILSTAVVHAYDSEGSPRACRVLLDCESQANFVSKKFVKALGLQTRPLSVSISGVNGTLTTSSQVAQIKLQSRFSQFVHRDH
ncbi:PREDICTED: uncharacterized protein LOC108778620 [Cyphomyrmex costatus]|uniref:uncharacterized protein LOC108778620 n=1 Tax=Cyphomyrmex costatus TaxID=456900 RepID=UPI0008522555|nr:PREDICTED: uncharacterized protein LOC108778620 [Cyphomyrmex costatus]